MIRVFDGQKNSFAGKVVSAALARSVTPGLVETACADDYERLPESGVFVFVEPSEAEARLIAEWRGRGAKIIVFGQLPHAAAAVFGLKNVSPLADEWKEAAGCESTPIYRTTRSRAEIVWSRRPLAQSVPFTSRPFLRFDYADEWNNLGFGRITATGDLWSIAQNAQTQEAQTLAQATTGTGCETPFVTLMDRPEASLIWWNRAAGPVDSCEWALIEAFLADWRADELPCVPVVSELPWGYDAAITMRLDCDEDIASARPLFELYRARGIPFSVAIKTGQDDREDHFTLLKDILAAGGAVLSHSVTHAPRWGGSLEACAREAKGSIDWLEERIPGLKVRHAVSPFHQNPAYVPEGLKAAGLKGFVGGIIANDPEMLLARGGYLPGDDTGVVSHSQQCMMHGDCILEEEDPLQVNKQAFLNAMRTQTLFGYLDHPFSERYDYGWGTEEHRLRRHGEFLDFISEATRELKTVWVNEDDALDWIAAKAGLTLTASETGFRAQASEDAPAPKGFSFAVRFKGEYRALSDFAHE